ncbi:MAG: hypothetical protein E7082_01280 [Bacteroidales bacterium]|nr:hypothetical protein [Bacteroidales bacterium]
MKKIVLAIIVALGIGQSADARDRYERTDESLPQAAKLTLQKHFKAKVALVKIEKTIGTIQEYEVILTDGTDISFDAKGNWDSVETPINKVVPSKLIPKPIVDYVTANYKKAGIVSIDKENYGYDVELSNGIEMKFDKAGNFKRFD